MRRVAVTCGKLEKAGPYLDAVRAAGLDPVLVTPAAPLSSLDGMGLLLTGGTDLDPGLYGQAPQPESEDPDTDRDALELALLLEALDTGVPVLAICRGMQLFNVAHPGGTLSQHIENHEVRGEDRSLAAHDVTVKAGTRLASILGPGAHPVNSRHHQAANHPGEGLVVSARSTRDGVIEGLERPDLRFAVAVQWHPEDQIHRYPQQLRLFEAFASMVRSE